MRDFDTWLKSFRSSIADYKYYVDFGKVHKNVDAIKVQLNILNSLIGSKNIETDFRAILRKYPETLKCIPILLAKRGSDIKVLDRTRKIDFHFDKANCSIDDYVRFMRETGLFDLIENHLVCNLVDYVTGIETGLDSNGRKNRGGQLMENLVESYLRNAKLSYFKEMTTQDIENKWGISLSPITNNGSVKKRFDFVVQGKKTIYGIETNFYESGGSKLNETARSYKTIAQATVNLPQFKFIWVTDGYGWNSAKNNLKETFDVLPHLYNIADLENGVFSKILI